MRHVTVYHAEFNENLPNFCENGIERKTFKKVAYVLTDELEKAYKLTNHITTEWPFNEGVMCVVDGARSTSVGDIMVVHDADQKPVDYFVVAGIGFDRIDPELVKGKL